ncbi:apoptosis regulatory protein Siva-like isoform X2 [Cydia pomonella]|uniref:apoptosis regulatory protein Siva-like isoform X2 n=1 Tax=Cydia pomonella TaxID=82600 RepID=UPI002ADE30D0|nr:apoptosis regulatory protein Siva-like isoform X2 [Cydia pomonella]
MTKRSNPFTEDFVQQSKVHVGMKQFNNNEDRLQKVYEKTLELLFRGAKMPTKSVSEITTVNEIRKDGFKQLFLGKDGHLQQSGAVTEPVTQKCPCGTVSEDQCSYCEKALCGACQHPCERCQHRYCNHCCLTGSEGSEICVSCYS